MRRRGSTLPEVLVSLLILVPVAVVIMGLFPYAHSIDQRAWALSTAEGLAEGELQKDRGLALAGMAATSYHHLERGMDFLVSVSVTVVDANLKKVVADVSWQFQRAQDYRLTTMIANLAPR